MTAATNSLGYGFHELWTSPLKDLKKDDDDRIILPADAIPITLTVNIDGVAFKVLPQDLKLKLSDDTYCSGVQSSKAGSPQVLGTPFLKNVVAEFDIGGKAMAFRQRLYQ